MTTPFLTGDVARDEGLRLKAYPDPLSLRGRAMAKPMGERPHGWETLPGAPWTIGYGHTGPEVHEGLVWTLEQATEALRGDLAHAAGLLDKGIPWWRTLAGPRQDVLCNMCFNMGWDDPRTARHEGLSAFVNTLAHVKAGEFDAASEGMLASLWSHQVGGRAKRLAQQMKTGVRA